MSPSFAQIRDIANSYRSNCKFAADGKNPLVSLKISGGIHGLQIPLCLQLDFDGHATVGKCSGANGNAAE